MGMIRGGGRCFAFWGAFLCVGLGVARANAATIVVNNAGAATELSCNLEQAVAAANADVAVGGCAAGNGADEIVLQDALAEIEIVNALHVTEALTIDGAGTVLRGFDVGVIVEDESSVTIHDLTFEGGETAVLVESESALSLERVVLRENTNGALQIASGASLQAMDAHFRSNWSSSKGGALQCAGICKLDRVTFDDNWTMAGFGGAIAVTDDGELDVVNGTFYSNFVSCWTEPCEYGGSAIHAEPGAAARVAFATVLGIQGPDFDGPVVFKASWGAVTCSNGAHSGGYNLHYGNPPSGGSCAFGDTDGVMPPDPPFLSSLENRGGFVPVVDPWWGLAVRDFVPNCLGFDGVVTKDATGRARPQGQACDAGAREMLSVPEFEPSFTLPNPYFSAGTSAFTVEVRVDNHGDVEQPGIGLWVNLKSARITSVPQGCHVYEGSPPEEGDVAACSIHDFTPGSFVTFVFAFELSDVEDRVFRASTEYGAPRPYVDVEDTLHVRYCGDATVDPEEACEPSLSLHCSNSCTCEEGWQGVDCADPVVETGGAGGEGGAGDEAGTAGVGGLGESGEGGEGASMPSGGSAGNGGSSAHGGTAGTSSSGGRSAGGSSGATAGEPHEGGYGGDSETPGESEGDRHSKGCACGVASQTGTGLGWLSLGLAGAVWWRRARRTSSLGREQAR